MPCCSPVSFWLWVGSAAVMLTSAVINLFMFRRWVQRHRQLTRLIEQAATARADQEHLYATLPKPK